MTALFCCVFRLLLVKLEFRLELVARLSLLCYCISSSAQLARCTVACLLFVPDLKALKLLFTVFSLLLALQQWC